MNATAFLARLFGQAAQPVFRLEPILYVEGFQSAHHNPVAEVLLVAPATDGVDTAFQTLFHLPHFVTADLNLLDASLGAHAHSDQPLSFNLYADTVFDAGFESLLEKYRDVVAGHTFEILEHGDMPASAKPEKLDELHKKYGVQFALDDINPLDPQSQERLQELGPYVHMIKFHYSVMEEMRKVVSSGQFSSKQRDLINAIIGIHSCFPHVTLVAEGVRSSELGQNDEVTWTTEILLKKIGVPAIQIYTPRGEKAEPAAANSGFGSLGGFEPVARSLA